MLCAAQASHCQLYWPVGLQARSHAGDLPLIEQVKADLLCYAKRFDQTVHACSA